MSALATPDGGSLWWSSAFAVTPPESLSRVADVMKLWILEQLFEADRFHHLRYVGSNRPLAEVLRLWSDHEGCAFEWEPTPAGHSPARHGRPGLRERLPHIAQAALYLRSFLRKWKTMRRNRLVPDREEPADVVVLTYFPNIDLELSRRGVFRSNYWGDLPALIQSLGLRVRWIWLYSDSRATPLSDAVLLRNVFNDRRRETREEHGFVEEAVTVTGLVRALGNYLRFLRAGVSFRKASRQFVARGSEINFYPILREDWLSSLWGTSAMYSSLYREALFGTIRELPRQTSRLLYLWENQSWEYLLLRAWKAAKTEPALGVAHVPNCPAVMNLRNRLGALKSADKSYALPDGISVVGRPSIRSFERLGWPRGILTAAEALRFQHLAGKQGRDRRDLPAQRRHLLVVTGIMPDEVRLQLELLARAGARGGLSTYSRVSIKPHPFCPVDDVLAELSLTLQPTIVEGSLDKLFGDVDVVYCASSTSAAAEVAWFGLPLILSGAVRGMNLNPFKGVDGVRFAETTLELVTQLQEPPRVDVSPDYFQLDPDLPLWRAALAGPVVEANRCA